MIDWDREFEEIRSSKLYWIERIKLSFMILVEDIVEFLRLLTKGELK